MYYIYQVANPTAIHWKNGDLWRRWWARNRARPNAADVFAHVYYIPAIASHARAVAWLRNASWTKALVTEVYDSKLKREIIASFPEFAEMQRQDVYEQHMRRYSSANRLSMWRKVWLANELRVAYATRFGTLQIYQF